MPQLEATSCSPPATSCTRAAPSQGAGGAKTHNMSMQYEDISFPAHLLHRAGMHSSSAKLTAPDRKTIVRPGANGKTCIRPS